MNRVLKASLASLTLAGAALALSGCGNIIEAGADKVENAVQSEVEQQLEDNLGVDVEFGENASVPEDFPASIPLPEGTVISALGLPDGWAVTFKLDSATAIDPVLAGLESQGYALEQDLEQAGGRVLMFVGSEYSVAILLIVDGDQPVAQYTVTPATQ